MVLLSILLLTSVQLIAHPPTDIIITYNLATKTISVIIEHAVKDPLEHFIHEGLVKVNGKKAVDQEAICQTSAEGQVFTYIIPGLKEGDTVSVTGDCNKFGELEKSVVIKADLPAKAKAIKTTKKVK